MLDIIQPGTLTTIQDQGRFGWACYGFPESGPMDRAAHAAANWLVGNWPSAAALEICLVGPVLLVQDDALIAICGADFEVGVNHVPVPGWHSVYVRAGSLLRFGNRRSGARAYLAIAGGIDVSLFLNSRATYLPAGLGGFKGRALRCGDRLVVGCDPLCRRSHQLWLAAGVQYPEAKRPDYSSAPTLRVVLGPQENHFAPDSVAGFLHAVYTVSSSSDRMGVRLEGPTVAHRDRAGIVSDGVVCGSIQIPPDGHPIVMMVDHQTTGGYPKIATVIQADLPLLAQCLPGDTVRFRAISLMEARAATRDFLRAMAQ